MGCPQNTLTFSPLTQFLTFLYINHNLNFTGFRPQPPCYWLVAQDLGFGGDLQVVEGKMREGTPLEY